ncbi:MAG: hypothetical protein Q8S84_05290 [bacterium]|nr:hypothetical protein [bacterium]
MKLVKKSKIDIVSFFENSVILKSFTNHTFEASKLNESTPANVV